MMRYVLGILIILAFFGLGRKLLDSYVRIEKHGSATEPAAQAPASPSAPAGMAGLPPSLEPVLQAAQRQGASGLRAFLARHRFSIQDPRLAAIELDYVVLISLQDPAEAKRVFKEVQQRTPTWSPIYGRVKSLAKNYQ